MLEILTDNRIGFEARLLNEWQLDFFKLFFYYSLPAQSAFLG